MNFLSVMMTRNYILPSARVSWPPENVTGIQWHCEFGEQTECQIFQAKDLLRGRHGITLYVSGEIHQTLQSRNAQKDQRSKPQIVNEESCSQ